MFDIWQQRKDAYLLYMWSTVYNPYVDVETRMQTYKTICYFEYYYPMCVQSVLSGFTS